MSWRTHGQYKGLSRAERKFLRKFDRKWDTKAEGRSREDALDHMSPPASPAAVRPKARRVALEALPAPEIESPRDEVELMLLIREVERFTVPRPMSSGWSIHLTLRSGEKVRVHYRDEIEAGEAYKALTIAFAMLTGV